MRSWVVLGNHHIFDFAGCVNLGTSVPPVFANMFTYNQLAIPDPRHLGFGVSPKPLSLRSGMVLGGGTVYPELNFTLPTMFVDANTMPAVLEQYRQMVTGAIKRAAELHVPGLILEFETLPPMTENPDWGMQVVEVLLEGLSHGASLGVKSAMRMTPNDTREMVRPPVMRSGALYENMLELFERSAEAGCELLSIESVGGKEVHDEALTMGDIRQVVFALSVLGVRDMRFLWSTLAQIAAKYEVHAAGDTACGFANTAMVLAEQKLISRVFAAVVRAISAARSLVAYECGAVGPGKDCGYENVILKAITGYPMAMEGKTAACAHLSPVGNVAAAACDTWSNESVQNVKLLGGMAPTCYMEQLAYDCRLFNEALKDGPDAARQLRDWMVRGDVGLDPQALILAPDSAIRIGQAIVSSGSHLQAGRAAGLEALAIIAEAYADGKLQLIDREAAMLEKLKQSLETIPDSEDEFIGEMMDEVDTTTFRPQDYEL